MTIKNLIYTIPLSEELYEPMIGAFASATGWDAQGGITPLEHSRKKLNEYVNQTITSYQANQAAEAARIAAIVQSSSTLDSITTTLVVE